MSQTNSDNEDTSRVEEVRDFYTRTRRYDEQVLNKETPVVDLGERADYDLRTEEGQKAYQMARYSCEATEELGRAARRSSFSFGSFTLRGKR